MIDQNFGAAMIQDLGSSPAAMGAAKIADLFGCPPGHSLEIDDAVQAYVQAEMKGTSTWVCMPPEYRPARWVKTYPQYLHCTAQHLLWFREAFTLYA